MWMVEVVASSTSPMTYTVMSATVQGAVQPTHSVVCFIV